MLSEMQERHEWGDDRPQWWSARWIPFLTNGAGDLTCVDTDGSFTGAEGQILEFWHDSPDRFVVAPDLDTWLAHFVSSLERGEWTLEESGNFSLRNGGRFPNLEGFPVAFDARTPAPAPPESVQPAPGASGDVATLRAELVNGVRAAVGRARLAPAPCSDDASPPLLCACDLGEVCPRCWGEPSEEAPGVEAARTLAAAIEGLAEPELRRLVDTLELYVPGPARVLAMNDGTVEQVGGDRLSIATEYGSVTYRFASGREVLARPGDAVKAGEALVEGAESLRDLQTVFGDAPVAERLLETLQPTLSVPRRVLLLLVRPMVVAFVRVESARDTSLSAGELVARHAFMNANREAIARGGDPAIARATLVALSELASLEAAAQVGAEVLEALRNLLASFQGTQRELLAELEAEWTAELEALGPDDRHAAATTIRRKIKSPKLADARDRFLDGVLARSS